ncbi:MAG TPA: GxxExxY protein [Pyrinomonadaceae bacterium]|nr:GxxExxY protein [Pyrinomonadaceae bacterium]
MITDLKHHDLTQRIIAVFYDVYNALGHGFLESVYHKSLYFALKDAGLTVHSGVEIPVWFRGRQVGCFEGDLLVEKCVLLELKAARTLDSSHKAQLLNYLRATDIEIGLLLNFGVKPEVRRLIYDNPRKKTR